MHCQISSCTVGQHTQPPQRSMNPPIIFRKDCWLQCYCWQRYRWHRFIGWTECRSDILSFLLCFGSCWLLASVGVWLLLTLLFWLLASVGSYCFCFWPFPSKQHTSKVNECFFDFSICSFYSLHSPQLLLICHIFKHVHVFHVMFLKFLWMISQTSRIWQDFHDLAFLFHFSICLCQHSQNIAAWEHHISNWKETAAKSTGAWTILAKSKEHSVNRRNHEIGTKQLIITECSKIKATYIATWKAKFTTSKKTLKTEKNISQNDREILKKQWKHMNPSHPSPSKNWKTTKMKFIPSKKKDGRPGYCKSIIDWLSFGFTYFFTPIWGTLQFWLIFFNWLETTLQLVIIFSDNTLHCGS